MVCGHPPCIQKIIRMVISKEMIMMTVMTVMMMMMVILKMMVMVM